MSKEKIMEEFDKLGFYELEEIEKPFKLNQEIIRLRNKVKKLLYSSLDQVRLETIKEVEEMLPGERSLPDDDYEYAVDCDSWNACLDEIQTSLNKLK